MTCMHCGGQLPPNILACPSCHALVHAAELKSLAAAGETELAAKNFSEALSNWRRMQELLPPGSSQHTAITKRISDLSHNLDKAELTKAPKKPNWGATGGALGALALVIWKFKFIAVFFLTKAKLLLLGLTKLSTLSTMLLYLAVVWDRFGWGLAVGVVLSIYVHEMGHIYQLRRYGIAATAPMFIPGFGALIRVKQYPVTPHEEAVTGLAGPVWGLGATAVSYAIHLATGIEVFAAIAKFAAYMNLFNLLPVWQLDGSHAFRALTKLERGGVTLAMVAMWLTTGSPLLILLFIVAGVRSFMKSAEKRDGPIFAEFVFLVVVLSLLTQIPVDLKMPGE